NGGASLFRANPVRLRVNPKQHVALAYRLVVADVEFDDTTADLRSHVDKIRLQIGVVRARSLVDPARYEQSGHKDTDQRHHADQGAQCLAEPRHRSMTEPEQPDE